MRLLGRVFSFPAPDPTEFARLKALPAEEALATFLAGDFRLGEEAALFSAVQRGLALPMSLERLADELMECLDDELDVATAQQRLIERA